MILIIKFHLQKMNSISFAFTLSCAKIILQKMKNKFYRHTFIFKKLAWIMLLCCISQLLLAQDYMSKSEYSKQQFKIDGYANEWAQPFNFYDGDTKIRYSLRNDSSNFYFCFQTWNEATEMRIMRAGLQIKLSAKGKKQKYFGSINFPITTKNPTTSTTEHHSKHLDISGFKSGFVLQNNTMNIAGFKTRNDSVICQ